MGMRKLLVALISFSVLVLGAPTGSAAQKPCTDDQLLKIYKLAVEFNNNRSYILKFALNVDRSVAGILKSQGDRDVAAERLWWENFNTATSEAKRLTTEEKRILKLLKNTFTCSGHGTDLDPKYGYIGVKKNVKSKVWPTSVRLTPAPENNLSIATTALSTTEAKDCTTLYKNRNYVEASNYTSGNLQYFKMENMSDCVVFFELAFEFYCPDRNTNLITNPNFPYPANFKGNYKLEPRQVWEINEGGFASTVSQKCYSLTNRMPNFVRFQGSSPSVRTTGVNSPVIVLTPSQVQANRKTCVVGGSCPLGSKGPGGGIVFYDAGSKQSWGRYLEVAPSGWSGSTLDPKASWCTAGQDYGNFQTKPGSNGAEAIESFLGIEIGSGPQNTDLMVAKCTEGAANIARNYSGGGKSDWSLPSRNEAEALWKHQLNDKTIFEENPGAFWTSTEWGYHNAIARFLDVSVESLYADGKNTTKHVRPIRAF